MKIIKHVVLSNGMHFLHIKHRDRKDIEVRVLTFEEYTNLNKWLDWWEFIKIKFNIK